MSKHRVTVGGHEEGRTASAEEGRLLAELVAERTAHRVGRWRPYKEGQAAPVLTPGGRATGEWAAVMPTEETDTAP